METTPAASMVVQTEGGPVTLCELGVLKNEIARCDAEAQQLGDKASSLAALAQEKFVDCGRQLLSAYANRPAPEGIRSLVEAARPLEASVEEETAARQTIADAQHHGVGKVFANAATWHERHRLGEQLASTTAKLNPILIEIARQATDFPGDDIAAIHAQAVAAENEAADAASQRDKATTAGAIVRNEVQRREESVNEVGFDALYTAAYLQTYGSPNVQSPLVLKRGEHAAVSVSATLARQRTKTQWVGGSSGFSFPIGHTGIRYRVGSYHGHPVEQQYLAHLDTGTLVVTDQRVAFVGQAKSSAIPMEKLLHVECYKDAIAIFKEGRENADFYLVDHPQYVLFMINWILARSSDPSK